MAGIVILGVIAYIFLCALVAWIGRYSRLGFWGILIIAFFLTPFITFIPVILLGSKQPSSKEKTELNNSAKS